MSVKMNTKEFERKFKSHTEKLKKTMQQSVVELAQVGAVQLAYRVPPYGINGKSKNIAELAILKDVSKAYDTVGQTFNTLKKINKRMAYAYLNATNSGDFITAENIARKYITGYEMRNTDSGQHLDSVRGNNGRVSNNNQNVMGLESDSEIDRIKSLKVVHAGTLKAGFMQAGKSIGMKSRIAKWLNKSSNLGSSQIIKSFGSYMVVLINHVKYASDVMKSSLVKQAQMNAYKNHVKKMERQLEAEARKF